MQGVLESKNTPWILFVYSLDTPWILLGYSLDTPRILLGYSSDTLWILLGYSLDTSWILFGYSMDIGLGHGFQVRFTSRNSLDQVASVEYRSRSELKG